MDKVTVSKFKAHEKNTLRGFFTLHYGHLEISDCTLHEKNGRPWFGFPGKKIEKPDGTTSWVNGIYIADRSHLDKLQAHVCGLLKDYLMPAPLAPEKASDNPPF